MPLCAQFVVEKGGPSTFWCLGLFCSRELGVHCRPIRLNTAQASKCTGNSTTGNVSGGAVEARPSTVQLPIVQASNCLLRVRLIAGFPLGAEFGGVGRGRMVGQVGEQSGGSGFACHDEVRFQRERES
jgi:hypothetical protein